jgi:hypothetical protein
MVRPSFRGLSISILGAYIILFLGSGILTTQVNQLTDSLGSMYYDRLIVSKDIFFVQDLLYRNRLLTEEHIYSQRDTHQNLSRAIINSNAGKIDSLIHKISQTFLVDDEKIWMDKFYHRILTHREIEERMLNRSIQGQQEGALEIFNGEGEESFAATLETLNGLEQVQDLVGLQLLKDAQRKANLVRILSQLLLAISLISATFLLFYLKNYAVVNLTGNRPSNN